MAAPVTTNAIGRRIPDALARNWRYLRSWQTLDGRFAGMIATWWSSTVETAVPHPMNQFPIILGLLRLHEARVAGDDWLEEARRVGDGLAASVDAEGLLENGWGDIPGKTTGPIFYTSCVRALAALFDRTQEQRYLDAALRMDSLVTRRWTRGDRLVGCLVTNQVLSWAWSKSALAGALGRPSLIEQARRIARGELAHQLRHGALSGGFYQGRFDDRLISVYVGKCIEPLLEIHAATGDEELLTAASNAGAYMTRQEVEHGLWLNYHEPTGAAFRAARLVARLDRRVFRLTLPVYRLRRALAGWTRHDYPSWVARSADTVRALWRLSDLGRFDAETVARYTTKLLDYQYAAGGFPNTFGFFGDPCELHWQDAAPSTRWNAYAFLLLSELAARFGVAEVERLPPAEFDWRLPLHGGGVLQETHDRVELTHAGGVAFRIRKHDGFAEFVAPEWRGDLSGPRARPRQRSR